MSPAHTSPHDEHGEVRVLHVDDEPDFADMAATFIQREDDRFAVETETSASNALDRLNEERFDCIVSDYDMPEKNGIEFLKTVRETHPELPFILYTGKGSEEVASDAISAGATDYLQKGAGTDQYTVLANRITNAVEQYHSKREIKASRERLSLFVERSPLGVIEWTEELEVARVNETAEDILGYPENELLGNSWEMIVPESGRSTVADVLADLLGAKGGNYSVNENVRKDGERIVCEWHNDVITDGDGQPVAAFSQFQDITEEHRRRQRQKRQREAIIELAYDDNVVEGDFRTAVQRVTETATEVLDVPRVNVWIFDDLEGVSRCVDHYDRRSDTHDSGMELSVDEYSTYYEALETEWVIAAADAQQDPRTAGLTENYLDVHDVGALLDAPIRSEGEFVGVVCHEHLGGSREWTDDEIEFATSVAGIVHRALRNREQKERQRELEAEREFIEQSLDTLDDIFYHVDTDGNFQRWNSTLPELTGYSDEEIGSMNALEFFGDEHRETIRQSIHEILENGSHINEAEITTADGRQVLHEFRGVRTTDKEGETTGIIGIARDITERKERERQLEEKTEELERMAAKFKKLYRTLFEEAPVMAVITRSEDGRTVIEDCNDQFIEALGYDEDAVVGSELAEFYTPESAGMLLEGDGYKRSLDGEFTREKRDLLTADGEVVETLLRAVPRRAADGDIIGTVAMYIDITEREEVKRANERLEEFTSVVSHDLRNPLNVALARLELADEECDSEHLDHVEQALDRMEALIDGLLTVAQEGEEVTDPQPVDLVTVIDACWETVETNRVSLLTDIDRGVRADRSRLKQVFENLFRNSIEHGGADVTVTIGELDDGFYVEDDGLGIPDDERDDVFEAGYSNSARGTGFGLSIVQRIVNAHDWQIRVTDGSDGGARFEITGVGFVAA